MPLSHSVITHPSELERLRPAWRALLDRSESNQPTLSPSWLLAWWRIFGPLDGRRLRVLAFFRGSELVGLAPLLSRRHWYRRTIPFRRLELMGSGEDEADESCSDYIGLVLERGAEAELVERFVELLLAGRLERFDELLLANMDGSSPLPELLIEALRRRHVPTHVSYPCEAWYIALPSTWEAYLASLSSSKRYLIGKSVRDFEKWAGGPGELIRARNAAELEEGKRILASLHGERWGARGHEGAFESPRFAGFHAQVMPALLEEGALDLLWLKAHGEPIAALYNIVWNRKVHFYQSGRKLEVPKNIRPGIVSHAYAIRRAIAAGCVEYDFLAGTSQYKMQLALASRRIAIVRAVPSTALERARLLAEEGAELYRSLRTSVSRPPPIDDGPKDGPKDD